MYKTLIDQTEEIWNIPILEWLTTKMQKEKKLESTTSSVQGHDIFQTLAVPDMQLWISPK